jgi:hypothetical protein
MARGGKREGAGRPNGSLDKNNKQLREMILEALDKKGGVTFLVDIAGSHPQAFVSLLGRVLPTQLAGDGGGPVKVDLSGTVAVEPAEAYKRLLNG